MIDSNLNRAGQYGIGRYGRGNIDLFNRPQYVNKDGSVSTVESTSFKIDGKEVLIPTIRYNGQQAYKMNDAEALDWYNRTGEFLGKFNTVAEANDYANRLHLQQKELYTNPKPLKKY